MIARNLAATAAFAALGAQAQSNVTLYGIVDGSLQYLDGASHISRVQSGGQNGSRLGFRGTEDLGDGFKALFTLEMGFNIDEGTFGQGGIAFGRQAFVGLHDWWGEVTGGRQYGSLYRLSSEFNPFGVGSSGPTPLAIGGFAGGYEPFRGAGSSAKPPAAGATGNGGPARINNSVRYATPSWQGLQATAIVGLGEVTGGTGNNRIVDLSARYTNGPFDAYLLWVSDEAKSAASPTDVETIGGGMTYKTGPYKVYAGIISTNDKRPENQDGRGYWIGGDYSWGRNIVRAQWLQNEPRYGTANKTNAYGLGYEYDFSKRTALYSSVTRFQNDTNAGGGLGRYTSAIPAGATRQGDANLTEVVLGVRHIF